MHSLVRIAILLTMLVRFWKIEISFSALLRRRLEELQHHQKVVEILSTTVFLIEHSTIFGLVPESYPCVQFCFSNFYLGTPLI